MKRTIIALLVFSLSLLVAGCGSNNSSPPTFVTQILSDPALDGDIARDPVTGLLTIRQGNTQSVFVGIDPVTGQEFRAFLDFPLGGQGGVPIDAIISSATLEIFINSILPSPFVGNIPIRIDLVDFQPPTLLGSDFDRTLLPALATTTIVPPISQADFGQPVPVDVTPLMAEAQRLGLSNFQVRILRELGPAPPGLIEINDTTGPQAAQLAPLLEVVYF